MAVGIMISMVPKIALLLVGNVVILVIQVVDRIFRPNVFLLSDFG